MIRSFQTVSLPPQPSWKCIRHRMLLCHEWRLAGCSQLRIAGPRCCEKAGGEYERFYCTHDAKWGRPPVQSRRASSAFHAEQSIMSAISFGLSTKKNQLSSVSVPMPDQALGSFSEVRDGLERKPSHSSLRHHPRKPGPITEFRLRFETGTIHSWGCYGLADVTFPGLSGSPTRDSQPSRSDVLFLETINYAEVGLSCCRRRALGLRRCPRIGRKRGSCGRYPSAGGARRCC